MKYLGQDFSAGTLERRDLAHDNVYLWGMLRQVQ